MATRCWFTERVLAENGMPGAMWHYEQLRLKTPGPNAMTLDAPPVTGDIVILENQTYKVLGRQWHYVQYGSPAWNGDERQPYHGHLCTVVVERCDGIFVDEADDVEEDQLAG